MFGADECAVCVVAAGSIVVSSIRLVRPAWMIVVPGQLSVLVPLIERNTDRETTSAVPSGRTSGEADTELTKAGPWETAIDSGRVHR